MSNIFEIYVRGYGALGELLVDLVHDVANWADGYLTDTGTNVLVTTTIVDRAAGAVRRSLAANPRTAGYAKAVPVAAEFAKLGFAMVVRGKTFKDAAKDRTMAALLDSVVDKSHAAEVRSVFKNVIIESINQASNDASNKY